MAAGLGARAEAEAGGGVTGMVSEKQTITERVDEIIVGLERGNSMNAYAKRLVAALLHLVQAVPDPTSGMRNAPLIYGADRLGVSRGKVQKMVGLIRQASRSMASQSDLAIRQFKDAREFWLTER